MVRPPNPLSPIGGITFASIRAPTALLHIRSVSSIIRSISRRQNTHKRVYNLHTKHHQYPAATLPQLRHCTTPAQSPPMSEPTITSLQESDCKEWERLFRAYIAFYKTSIPDEQYPKTFARILDPERDLYGLVLRDGDDPSKLLGIAHFFPHQTPWREEMLMMFNDLFIDPNIRSRGYGRKMIEAVAQKSKEMGCFRLQWLTQHNNVTARKLYDTLATTDFVAYRMPLE